MSSNRTVAIIRVDVAELAVRMWEANYGMKRPMPNPVQALTAMEPEVRAAWLRTAQAAAEYLAELAANARPVSSATMHTWRRKTR